MAVAKRALTVCEKCDGKGWIQRGHLRLACGECERFYLGDSDHAFNETNALFDRALNWYYDHKAMLDRATLPIFATLARPPERITAPKRVTKIIQGFIALEAKDGLSPQAARIWHVMLKHPQFARVGEERGILHVSEGREFEQKLFYKPPSIWWVARLTGISQNTVTSQRAGLVKALKKDIEVLMGMAEE